MFWSQWLELHDPLTISIFFSHVIMLSNDFWLVMSYTRMIPCVRSGEEESFKNVTRSNTTHDIFDSTCYSCHMTTGRLTMSHPMSHDLITPSIVTRSDDHTLYCHTTWWPHPPLSHDLMTTPSIVTWPDDHTLYCYTIWWPHPLLSHDLMTTPSIVTWLTIAPR